MKVEFKKPLKTTDEDMENFEQADKCHICHKQHTGKDIRVRDHCHRPGKFRGSAH